MRARPLCCANQLPLLFSCCCCVCLYFLSGSACQSDLRRALSFLWQAYHISQKLFQRCEWRPLLASVTPLRLRSPWAAPRSPTPCETLLGQLLCEEGTLSTQRQWPVAKNTSDVGSGCCDSGHHLEGQVTLESRTVSRGLTFRS